MIAKRLRGLFRRYVARHGKMRKPGFSLLNDTGKQFGHIDCITLRDGCLRVEGWALSELVGLTHSTQSIEYVPRPVHDDVLTHISNDDTKTAGFVLEIRQSTEHTFFWAKVGNTRYVYTLPQPALTELRIMQLKLAAPFFRDGVRAFPAAIRWLIHRDTQSVSRIKSAFGLNTVTRSNVMNTQLFSQDVSTGNTISEELSRTGVTVVIPVYNAFDLLPEVLRRVVDHTDLPWRLIVVEDCSSDERVRPWLLDWHANLPSEIGTRITLIKNETNLGFIRSVNRAFAMALPFEDHVVLLNSDAFVPPHWASRLIRPLLDGDNVATVTPMSNDAEIFNIPVICQREELQAGDADAIDRVAAQFSSAAALAEVPVGVGFCMAMHIDYLRKLPEFDTIFGSGYGEEVDWCQRVRQLGGRHMGLGGLFVEHRGGTSFGSVEKLKLIRRNNKVISQRYPLYDAQVQDFIRHDPLNSPRLALAMAWAGIRQKEAIPVYLAHDMSGGAEHYLQNRLKADLKAAAAAIVLRVGGPTRWQIELHSANGVTCGATNDTDFMRRMLSILPARQIIYSCGVGDRNPVELPEILVSLATEPGDRIEVLMHDFLPLSPSYTLLESDGAYHGLPIPNPGSDDPAHTARCANGTRADLSEWRNSWGKLMQAANNITVFSENSRAIVAQAYPLVTDKLTVTPHNLLTQISTVKIKPSGDGVPVIGVLGNIGYHKGIAVLRDLSQILAKTGRGRLVVIGNIDLAYSLAPPARSHGDYRPEEISSLAAHYGITCWLIPSIWPETFSYTTHEALATGLPVWSFDLGAQGDAVRAAAAKTGQGGTIPLIKTNAGLEMMLDIMLADRSEERTHA